MRISKYLLLLSIILLSCCDRDIDPVYRDRMREFVIAISNYAKSSVPSFIIIPQNGIELVTTDGENDGAQAFEYLHAIDANGQEDLFYGYNRDNQPTPDDETEYLTGFLDISKNAGNTILVTDYCSTSENMDDSYEQNDSREYVSFAATHRELDNIPAYPDQPHNMNNDDIVSIDQVRNFLYLINPENFSAKDDFINAVSATNYDLIIMDLFFTEEIAFNAADISLLKHKANGASRLVVCYISVGEAEDYRYYWQSSWNSDPPSWMDRENPDWEGNYKVKYWETGWQSIIFGNDSSYIKKILDAGFDGAYLDIIEAFEYYE